MKSSAVTFFSVNLMSVKVKHHCYIKVIVKLNFLVDKTFYMSKDGRDSATLILSNEKFTLLYDGCVPFPQ